MSRILTFGWRDCLPVVLAGREGVGGVGMGVATTVGVAEVGGATVCVKKYANIFTQSFDIMKEQVNKAIQTRAIRER